MSTIYTYCNYSAEAHGICLGMKAEKSHPSDIIDINSRRYAKPQIIRTSITKYPRMKAKFYRFHSSQKVISYKHYKSNIRRRKAILARSEHGMIDARITKTELLVVPLIDKRDTFINQVQDAMVYNKKKPLIVHSKLKTYEINCRVSRISKDLLEVSYLYGLDEIEKLDIELSKHSTINHQLKEHNIMEDDYVQLIYAFRNNEVSYLKVEPHPQPKKIKEEFEKRVTPFEIF